jgi:PAS domain S-box-containing protein
MKPGRINNDPAFPVMAMDILSNVLSRADHPGDLGTYLTEEIRDLTGARCVLLIQCLCTATVTAHRVVSVNPLRRREWAESPAVRPLYDDVVHRMPAAQFWRGDEPFEVAGLLRREGFELSMAFPLNAGGFRVGAMLLLGLPDEEHISSVLSLLNDLSAVVALVLRNSILFERQEQIIQERTAELSASEEKYRTLIECANDAVFIHEIKEDGMPGSFIGVNELACKQLGYSREELVLMSPMELDDPRYRDRIALAMERLLKDGHAVFETAQMAKNGRSIPVEVSTRVLELKGTRLLFSIVRDITERKRAEEALRESEAKYMDLYENAPDMYVSVNARTALIEQCNNTLSSTLGYSTEELIGRPVFEIYYPDCLEEVQKAFKQFRDTGEVRDKELQLRRKDGSRLDVSLNVSSVHDKDGSTLYSRSTLRDITESKRNYAINASRLHLLQFASIHSLDELLEETLNEAEKLTGSFIGFYHFVDDDERSLTLQNWSARTKAEFCKAEEKGLHYAIAEAGVWVDCVYQRKAVIHNDYASLPHRKGMPEGHATVIRELVVPVLRGDKIKAILGVGNKASDYIEKDVETIALLADLAWEIAERKRAEEARLRESALLRCVIDSVGDLIFIKDRDSVYLRCNKASEKFIGLSESEQNGKTDFDFFDRENAEAIQKVDQQVLAEGKPLRIEEWVTAGDGGRMLFDTLKAPYHGPDGDVMGLVGISRDITERKKAEEERLAHLRFFESMDRVNRAMQGTTDLEQMMSDVLDVVLSIFDCDRSFMFYPCDPEASAWHVPMERTRPEYPGALALGLVVPMDEEVSEQLRTLLNSDGPVKFGAGSGHPLPRDVSERFRFKSFMSMALYPKVGKPWQFGIHQCSYPRVWTQEEERLLKEIGRRLEDSLSTMLAYHEMRDSMEKLEEAQRIAHIGYWDRDIAGDRITLAGEACRIFGISSEESVLNLDQWHERWLMSIHPEDRERAEHAYVEAMLGGPRYNVEYRIVRLGGEVRYVHSEAKVTLDESGCPIRLLGMMQDITSRKLAEAEVERLKNYLSNIIDSMPSILVGMDNNRTVTQWNRHAEEMTGIPRASAVGKPISLLLPDFSSWITALQGKVKERCPASMEKLLIEKDGERRFYDLMLYPLIVNSVEGAVVRIEDVTERARIQELMVQTEKMMSVGGLAAGMAHEINNPLGIISQAAQNVERRVSPELPANRKAAEELGVNLEGIKAYFEKRQIPEFIGSIREASLRASRIIANMLQFSRRAGTAMQPTSPAEVIEQAMELAASDYELKMKFKFRSIEIIRDYAFDMPEVPMVVVEMEQVMLNLVKNAAQAMILNPPDRRPRITLRLRREERYALIEVEDNGPGMDEEVRRRVFEPFFTTKEPGKGTGLGLSVSYVIVTQNHKGLMEVESKPGSGTCFRVRLPLSKEGTHG